MNEWIIGKNFAIRKKDIKVIICTNNSLEIIINESIFNEPKKLVTQDENIDLILKQFKEV